MTGSFAMTGKSDDVIRQLVVVVGTAKAAATAEHDGETGRD
jgi:hypothetical protein